MNDGTTPGCFWHGAEPITLDDYRICIRCGHAFRTEQEYTLAVLARRTEIARSRETAPVAGCPLCCYDW